jgi:hypothetical protein
METRKAIRTAGRFLFWIGVVVTALNIENLANWFGIDNILRDAAQGNGVLAVIWAALTSDTALHFALVAVGFGGAAWIDYFAKRWDARHPTLNQRRLGQAWPIKKLAFDLSQHEYVNRIPAALFSKLTSRYETLRQLGFGAPVVPLDNVPAWLEIHQVYLNLIWPALEEGHVDLAIGESMRWNCEVTKDSNGQLQWPSSTAPETPL